MRQPFAPPRTSSEAPRLLNQVRDKIHLKHYSIRTEQAYTDWVGAYFVYRRCPADATRPPATNRRFSFLRRARRGGSLR